MKSWKMDFCEHLHNSEPFKAGYISLIKLTQNGQGLTNYNYNQLKDPYPITVS